MSVQFSSITTDEGQQFITAFAAGRLLGPVDNTHPNFVEIRCAMLGSLYGAGNTSDGEYLVELFDVAAAIARRFDTLSERLKVANGAIYLDGEVIENALTKQILRFMDEGVENWKPLVAFFEKVLSNPNEHSREQLYTWLDKHDFTISQAGDIVGYKGVNSDRNSISRGREDVLVNNEVHVGFIPNPDGAVVEMSRSLVHHDPAQGCSRGLHVATHDYASGWGDVCLEVHVNPRDVVSVPTDCNWSKVRVCRYQVVGEVERAYDAPVLGAADVDNSTDDDEAFDLDLTVWSEGDRGVDVEDDEFTVLAVEPDGDLFIEYLDGDMTDLDPSLARKVEPAEAKPEWSVGDRGVDVEIDDEFTVLAVEPDGDLHIEYLELPRETTHLHTSLARKIEPAETKPEWAEGDRGVDEYGDEFTVLEADGSKHLYVKYEDGVGYVVADSARKAEWSVGDRGLDWEGDPFTVLEVSPVRLDAEGLDLRVQWDDDRFGSESNEGYVVSGSSKKLPTEEPKPEWSVGDRGVDDECDHFTVLEILPKPHIWGIDLNVRWDDPKFGDNGVSPVESASCTKVRDAADPYADVRGERGRFTNGRPGSRRDSTGRFA